MSVIRKLENSIILRERKTVMKVKNKFTKERKSVRVQMHSSPSTTGCQRALSNYESDHVHFLKM